MNWTGSILTEKGRALQAKIEAGLCTLTLTRMKLGNGNMSESDMDTATDLVAPKYSLGITSKTTADNVCTITSVIASTQVTEGFLAKELGLYATDPDEGEILYMVAIDPNPDFVPPSTASTVVSASYALNVAISNAESISIKIDPNGLVTADMLTKAARLLERGKAYTLGMRVVDPDLASPFLLECTTPGTTGVTDIDFSGAAVGTTYTDGTVTWTVIKASTTAELDEHKSSATAHANLLAGTNFGTAIVNHLLGSTLASLVDAVSTDSLFSKLLKKALEAAGLQYNIGSNGYICFGALFGGLILQWGSGTTDSGGTKRITFPISFTDVPMMCAIHAGSATNVNMVINNRTNTYTDVLSSNTSANIVFVWFAISS